MDVFKIFVEDPAALAAPASVQAAGASPSGALSLDALLAGVSSGVGRAYLAGTRLGPDGETLATGLTSLAHPEAFVAPLLAWAAGREWHALAPDGGIAMVGDVPAALMEAAGPLALGPVSPDVLDALAGGDQGDALRALVAGGSGAAALVPEPAPDGHDWHLYAASPLTLLDAVRAVPPPPGVVRIAAPLHAARSESKFYLERWALGALPDWAERV